MSAAVIISSRLIIYLKNHDLLITAILCFTSHKYGTLYIDLYEIVQVEKLKLSSLGLVFA